MRPEIFFLILLAAANANAQATENIGCFVQGECASSLFIDSTDTYDAQGCLEFCRTILNCNQFTHYSDSGACLAFFNCNEVSTSTCSDCISGDGICPNLR